MQPAAHLLRERPQRRTHLRTQHHEQKEDASSCVRMAGKVFLVGSRCHASDSSLGAFRSDFEAWQLI